jgi:hypothetical protein
VAHFHLLNTLYFIIVYVIFNLKYNNNNNDYCTRNYWCYFRDGCGGSMLRQQKIIFSLKLNPNLV